MKSVQEVISEMAQTFASHEIGNPRRQAEELLCDLLDCSRLDLYTDVDRPLTESEYDSCRQWAQRRIQGEPLAYVCGKIQFYHCRFAITPNVLIPRQETEILVDKIAKSLRTQNLTDKVLWDVCCGSGCIGIALKKALPSLTVYASDCSEEALALTARNAAANGVEITCLKGDLLSPFHGKKAHYVVCNPPYISESDYAGLAKEVRDYEPRLALVGGQTGLEYYERLARELPDYLHPHAQVWFEIGHQQGEAVQKLFNGSPWKKNLLENDWAGHHRFFFLEFE